MILAFLATRLGRGLVVGFALVMALIVNNSHQRSIGASNVLVASKEQGAKANAKNETVRAAAERPGAADRVRSRFCRDC